MVRSLDLDEVVRRHGKHWHLRSDNGGAFIAGVLQRWLEQRELLESARELQVIARAFRDEYNDFASTAASPIARPPRSTPNF